MNGEDEDKIFDQKNILTDEFLQLRLEQYKLNLEIKQLIKRIYYLKKKYGNKDEEEIELKKKGKVFLKKFISNYSTVLKKDFNKLSDKEKREIYKSGLLKIRFNLNFYKFQKLKDLNKETPIDKFVTERKNTRPFYIKTQFGKDIQEELKIFEKKLEDRWNIWDKEIELDEDIFNEIEEEEYEEEEITREPLDEIAPDPYYFTDDDPTDLWGSTEYWEQGYLYEDDQNDYIQTKEEIDDERQEEKEEESYFNEKEKEKEKNSGLIKLKKRQLNRIKKETDKLESEIDVLEGKTKDDKNEYDLDDDIPF